MWSAKSWRRQGRGCCEIIIVDVVIIVINQIWSRGWKRFKDRLWFAGDQRFLVQGLETIGNFLFWWQWRQVKWLWRKVDDFGRLQLVHFHVCWNCQTFLLPADIWVVVVVILVQMQCSVEFQWIDHLWLQGAVGIKILFWIQSIVLYA